MGPGKFVKQTKTFICLCFAFVATADDITNMFQKKEVKNPPSKKYAPELLSEYILNDEKRAAKSSKVRNLFDLKVIVVQQYQKVILIFSFQTKNSVPSTSDNANIIDQFNKKIKKEAVCLLLCA